MMFALGAIWSLSTPPFASPDEPAHAVRAAATWTGDPSGREVQIVDPQAGQITIKYYEVESPYDSAIEIARCSAFMPTTPAGCGPAFVPSGETVEESSTAGFYPPLFYAAVGWTAAVSDGARSLYLMRLTHAGLCAAMIGLATWTLVRRRGSLALVGVTLAVTPMVGFLAGTVNSSGLEIAASIALWAGLIALLDPLVRPGAHRWGAAGAVIVAGSVLSFTRTFSPGYTAVICALALVAAPGLTPRRLLRRLDVTVPLAVLAMGAIAATLLIIRSGQFDSPATSGNTLPPGETALSFGLGFQESSFRQMVAYFGWLDTGTAQLTYYCWIIAIGTLIVGAVVFGAWRRSVGIVLTTLATVALPIAANWNQADSAGFVWQGRYSLPFAVGIPLLAGVAWDEVRSLDSRIRLRSSVLLAGLAGAGQVYAVYWALRRHSVGLAGDLIFFGDPVWSPPILGTWGTMGAIIALAAGMVFAVSRWPAEMPSPVELDVPTTSSDIKGPDSEEPDSEEPDIGEPVLVEPSGGPEVE
jgi:hypothetical protein